MRPRRSPAAGGESVRTVRPYVPGDPARLVHWPTSARRGELVVKEQEPPPAQGIALIVDLRGIDPEGAASEAAGIGQATLAAGGVVWLGTCEPDGPRRRPGGRRPHARPAARPSDTRRATARARRLDRRGGARVTTASRPRTDEPRRVAPGYRAVVVPAAIALGSIGSIAAERVNLPWILGALGGALAAALTVLALPSLPTRRVTVVLLGIGGLGALRHASFAGSDRSWLLVVWAAATMVTLVLVDRADAETLPALAGGKQFETRWSETARVSAIMAVVVIVAAVALVPTVTDRLGRRVWPGLDPNFGSKSDAPASLRESSDLDLTQRPRLSDKVVFTVDAARADFWRGETFDVYDKSSWTRSPQSSGDPFHPYFLDHDGTSVQVVPASNDIGAQIGQEFKQTFHIETDFSDIVFAAPSPRVVQTDKLLFERPDGTLRVGGGDVAGFGKGVGLHGDQPQHARNRRQSARRGHAGGSPGDLGAVRAGSRDDRPGAGTRAADHGGPADHVRQGAGDRSLARCEHRLLVERATLAVGRRRRRRVPVPESRRLVRADREQPGGARP